MSPVAPARRLALRVLTRVRERDSFAAQALDAALAADALSESDVALAHRLVYGTLQMQGSLDDAIDRFADRPASIEPRVRDALRMSAYEILFSAAADHAVVHQGVELVRSARPAAAGLANAVLRRLAEAASEFPWGDPCDLVVLARMTGHPLWIVELWVRELGLARARAVLEADNTPAPLYVAHNPFRGGFSDAVARLEREGASPGPGPLPGCIVCHEPAAAVRSGAVKDGHVIVTDAAAQIAASLLGAHPGGTVVDVAAGRGTKSVLIQAAARRAGAPATIHAVDIHPFKTRVLMERMGRLGVPGVVGHTGDATDPGRVRGLPRPGTADAALVDAPCTGLGTLRRHPERRWRVGSGDSASLAKLGLRLLRGTARLVRPGGGMVYSTCTIADAENGEVVAAFLESEEGKGFRVRRVDSVVPEQWREAVTPEGWFQSLTSAGGPDGHFVAVLEQKG